LRASLEGYLRGETKRVYSLVVSVPFSPIDIDFGILARGEWDGLKDRMRFWFLPKTGAQDKASCYVMIRKFDESQAILVCAHLLVNLEPRDGKGNPLFTIGILCNDEVRARATLGVFIGVPPLFHKRSEITLVEAKWRQDPEAVMRFAANVYSALAAHSAPGGEVHTLKFEPSADFMTSLKPGLDSWWDHPGDDPPGVDV
jgi:hypothetical protein